MNYYPGTALVLWVVGTGGQLFRLFANFIQMDWLGDIGVETRSDRQFAISQHRAGSNRYGGEAAETLVASQLANHTETVENGHLQIQEHNIGRISMDEVKGFASVCRFDHAVPRGLQDFSHQFPARQIVVRDENGHFGPLKPDSFFIVIFFDSVKWN